MLSGKHSEVSKNRLSVFTSKDKSSVNLFSKLFKEKVQVTEIKSYTPPNLKDHRISFTQAKEALQQLGKPVKVGDVFGPSWSTHWFELSFEIPSSWKGEEIQLFWDSEGEALVWSDDGTPLQGFLGSAGEDRRDHYVLSNSPAKGGEKFHLYVEMACTAMFGNGYGNGWGGLGPNPTDVDKKFTIKQVDFVAYDRLAHDLLAHFIMIADIAKLYPEDSFRASQALFTANSIMNMFYLDDRESWKKCLQTAQDFLKQGNSPQAHNITAIGHCHIDTAWLWPYAETKRKCARSWSSQLRICERHPEYKFGCSQAVQFEWVKLLYPKLYAQVQDYAKKGQFVPIGATWVEMDCNIPTGESFVRQFLYGQRFFKKEFGAYCNEFWLPDTFGYSAQLPQIIRNCGVEHFLTQKLSWAQFNKFPHHTFYWEGLDGTRVLTHFPPADTYNAQTTVKEVQFHMKNFKEKERCNESMMVFGHGDGGGGPLMEMVENLKILKDVDGLAKIEMRTPQEFFERCKKDSKDLAVWCGELYFEYHRGTYTSQAKNKLGNRQSEFLLRNIELIGVLNYIQSSKFAYPTEELDRLWKLLLLNQFHDVLPGSSINEVYRDSDEHYADIMTSGTQLLKAAIAGLSTQANQGSSVLFNSLGWDRHEIVAIDGQAPPNGQASHDGKSLIVVQVPSMGFASVRVDEPVKTQARLSESNGMVVLENDTVVATFNAQGKLTSLVDRRSGHEAIAPSSLANQFIIYEDVPMYWDAWDVDVYHLEKRRDINESSIKILERGPLRVSFEVSVRISELSNLKQVVSLGALSPRLDFSCEVDWHESHKFLKVEFPFNIRSLTASYEVQYGFIQRPTHWNTSWDVARFEVCAHKWADLSESGFGVSLLNDCKYGYATHGNVMRLSLLRSPKNPDPECDMGHHTFRYALLPHQGTFQQANVIRESFNFNVPLIVANNLPSSAPCSFFEVDEKSVIIDVVKKAEDNNEVIVRLYESFGGRASFKLKSFLPFKSVRVCNMLEETKVADSKEVQWKDGGVGLKIKPFEVITLALSL